MSKPITADELIAELHTRPFNAWTRSELSDILGEMQRDRAGAFGPVEAMALAGQERGTGLPPVALAAPEPPRLALAPADKKPTMGRVVLMCAAVANGALRYDSCVVLRILESGEVFVRNLDDLQTYHLGYHRDPVAYSWCWPNEVAAPRLDGQPFTDRSPHAPREEEEVPRA